ncbi:O-antigen ligase family protein [Hyphomonas sp.]|uniref:O-antigen ligase family protein n=1 Tax=Hyphomonas sp. TaxID=87 RepID=UPI00391C4882
MAYGYTFAGLMLLWPLLALLGTQGFAPLVGLTGIAALILARPKWPPALYAVAFLIFIAWAAASEFWSPAARQIITGNLMEGTFAIGARSLIIVMTALFGVLTLAAAARTDMSPRAQALIWIAFALHGAIALASGFISGPFIEAVYGTEPQDTVAGIQNVNRNINAFGLVLPLVAAALAHRFGLKGTLAAAVLTALMVVAAIRVDTQAGVLCVAGMIGGFALAQVLPRNAYRALFGLAAAYVLFAPAVMMGLIRSLDGVSRSLPDSFQSRLWSWEAAIGHIREAPLLGHGLGASRTWRETFAAHPEKLAELAPNWAYYPVIPGHPHNMPLHLWAETGLVGALLAAAALVLLAIRLPAPSSLRADVRFAIAGVAGASFSLFSFAYSVWNEAFWAGLALIAAVLVLFARRAAKG